MSAPIQPPPTCIAPTPENTIPPSNEPTSSEPVKPVEATEATTVPIQSTEDTAITTTTEDTAITTTTEDTTVNPTTEGPSASEPATQVTESAPAETAPAEKAVSVTEAEISQAPVTTTTPAPTEEPSKVKQEAAVVGPSRVAAVTPPPAYSSGPTWPALDKSHPLAQFQSRLGELLKTAEHDLIWGIKLSAEEPIPFHTTLVLQKFLRANSNNIEAAYNQLLQTLKWRKEFRPEAACEEEFSEARFGGLGYVMKTKTADGEKIVTYNIYGACKDPKRTFGDLNSFLRWRIALMEMGVRTLDLPNATVPIPDFNASSPNSNIDPYQMIQLHDYQNVSFLRMDSHIKAASKKTIEVMANYYPELLSIKYFVNIPVVMSWVFTAMKAILSKETVRKFRVISSGKGVASDLSGDVPKAYGGQGADLTEAGLTPKLLKDSPPPTVKEKKPSKKASLASLEKVKEKFLESGAAAAAPAAPPPAEATEGSSTAPAPNVATIPEAKEEEAAAEKASEIPASAAPADYPTKDESSTPSDAPATTIATSNTVVEDGTAVNEPVCSVNGGTISEQPAESAPVAVEETKSNEDESANKNSLPLAPVGANETVDVEEKLDESNTTAKESEPAAEAKTTTLAA